MFNNHGECHGLVNAASDGEHGIIGLVMLLVESLQSRDRHVLNV